MLELEKHLLPCPTLIPRVDLMCISTQCPPSALFDGRRTIRPAPLAHALLLSTIS